jgi:Flp pilus assembly protein TadG
VTAGTRARREERASASVEFALVLPLVLIMAMALLQIGLLAKDQLVVEGAARAGAREGAVTVDDTQAQQAAIRAAVSLDPNQLQVAVLREGGRGSSVTMNVVYHARVVVPLVSWLFPDSIDLSGTAVMRQETG